jgi:Xaa-Pro aminopeptidase
MNANCLVTPQEELRDRIGGLQQSLQQRELDGALVVQKTDLFYFAATAQQGWLYVPATGEPLLMVFKEYERARSESALSKIVSIASP